MAPGLLLNQHSCLPAAATATSTTLYASFQFHSSTKTHSLCRCISHSKYAILRILSSFFHSTSAFPLCFSRVLTVFHICTYVCLLNALLGLLIVVSILSGYDVLFFSLHLSDIEYSYLLTLSLCSIHLIIFSLKFVSFYDSLVIVVRSETRVHWTLVVYML